MGGCEQEAKRVHGVRVRKETRNGGSGLNGRGMGGGRGGIVALGTGELGEWIGARPHRGDRGERGKGGDGERSGDALGPTVRPRRSWGPTDPRSYSVCLSCFE